MPSKQEVRAWCRMCYGADWHANDKAARLAEARAALSVPSNFSAPYLGTASRATTAVSSAPKQRKATSQMTSSRNAAPERMATLQHSNDGGGKMKVMSSNKTVRLLQEDLIKEMSRGDSEGRRTEVIVDILQRLNEVDINLKILSETLIGATVMKLKKDDGVAISVSNEARKLIKKWKSIAEKAEANTTAKTDMTIKSTTTSGVLNRLKVAKTKPLKGNAASTKQGALTSQDLLSSSATHKTIAAKMISLLPDGATRQDAAAKKLIKAFPLLLAELDVRSREMTRTSESAGTRLPFAFRFLSEDNIGNNGVPRKMDSGGAMYVIHVPEECFVKIMSFLNGWNIVNASTVCKAWLYVSRMPVLWERFAVTDGLSNKSKKLNMTYFLALLERSQFANLKYLSLPYKVKLGKTGIKSIARVCPHLETWEVGFSHCSGQQTDNDLIEAIERFPNLTSIHTSFFYVTNFGITSAARMMGSQLLDLRIKMIGRYLSDSTLGVIAEHCPNLKHFAYILPFYRYYKPELDMLSGVGITQLVRGCRRLEVIELDHALGIRREDFDAILNMILQGNTAAMNGNGEFLLHKISLKGYPFVIGDKPFSIVDTGVEDPFQSYAHVDEDDVYAQEGDVIMSDED